LFAIRALEGLELVGEEKEILREIRREMESGDVVAKAVKELWKTSAHSVRSLEWLQSQGLLYFHSKIYVPDSLNLQQWIIFLCHDTKIAGHCERWKTLELVSHNYWWPQMSRYVGKYVSTCNMCLHTKAFHQPPVGELYPLSVPDAPWDVVSVDFIFELPEANGKDCIMVVVDSVTECSHFVDTVTTIPSIGFARLYVKHIWKHHGLPGKMLLDQGLQFVAEFMKELYSWNQPGCHYCPSSAGRQTDRASQSRIRTISLLVCQSTTR
jgi:Integrase zinc binding domain